MSTGLVILRSGGQILKPRNPSLAISACSFSTAYTDVQLQLTLHNPKRTSSLLKEGMVAPQLLRPKTSSYKKLMTTKATSAGGVPMPPLDLTEDNVKQVLADARVEFGQIFDTSVGMTGQVELAELDGPFVKISLKGRFWHKRSTVLARVSNYLKQRIPEILEVDIEDEKQLDDSPENF